MGDGGERDVVEKGDLICKLESDIENWVFDVGSGVEGRSCTCESS